MSARAAITALTDGRRRGDGPDGAGESGFHPAQFVEITRIAAAKCRIAAGLRFRDEKRGHRDAQVARSAACRRSSIFADYTCRTLVRTDTGIRRRRPCQDRSETRRRIPFGGHRIDPKDGFKAAQRDAGTEHIRCAAIRLIEPRSF